VESGAGTEGGRADGTTGGEWPGDGPGAVTVVEVVGVIPNAPGGSGPVEVRLVRTVGRTGAPFTLGLVDAEVGGGRLAFLL